MKTWKERGEELGLLVKAKLQAYGDSVETTEDLLLVLWPDGVPKYSYPDMLLVVRILDKLCRIRQAAGRPDTLGESPWKDIAGYSMRGWERAERLAGGGDD